MKISQQSRVLNGAGDLKKAVLPHNSPRGVCTYLKSLFVQFRASPVSSASALLHIQNQGATWQVFPQYSPLVSSSYLGFKLTNRLLQPTMNVPLTPNSPCPDTLISSAIQEIVPRTVTDWCHIDQSVTGSTDVQLCHFTDDCTEFLMAVTAGLWTWFGNVIQLFVTVPLKYIKLLFDYLYSLLYWFISSLPLLIIQQCLLEIGFLYSKFVFLVQHKPWLDYIQTVTNEWREIFVSC